MTQEFFLLLLKLFLLFCSKQMYLIKSLAEQGRNVAKSLLSSSLLRQFNTQKVFIQLVTIQQGFYPEVITFHYLNHSEYSGNVTAFSENH